MCVLNGECMNRSTCLPALDSSNIPNCRKADAGESRAGDGARPSIILVRYQIFLSIAVSYPKNNAWELARTDDRSNGRGLDRRQHCSPVLDGGIYPAGNSTQMSPTRLPSWSYTNISARMVRYSVGDSTRYYSIYRMNFVQSVMDVLHFGRLWLYFVATAWLGFCSREEWNP